MRARTLVAGMVVVLVSLTAAHGSVGYSLLDSASAADCKQLGKRLSRLQARYEEQCPSPTPDPTRSPSPTPTMTFDCSSGHFGTPPDKNPRARAITQKTFPPGVSVSYCVTLPGPVPDWPWASFSSTNHANTSCGDLQVTLTSPSGVNYYSGGTQPMSTLGYETGRWSVVVRLNDKAQAPCEPNKPFSLFVSW